MTIDTSGKWWKGSSPLDLDEYLRELGAENYPVSQFRLSTCSCEGVRFTLEVEQDEGIAKRTCVNCGAEHFICDSGEYYEPAQQLEKFKCVTCNSEVANVGVGYALYDDGAAVHWLYVGCRCDNCGVLGSMVDWKVGYAPSLQLMDQA